METKVLLECGFWQPAPADQPTQENQKTAKEDGREQQYLILHL